MIESNQRNIANVCIRYFMLVYLTVVLYLTVLGRNPLESYSFELEPFWSIRLILSVDYYGHGEYVLREILVNIALLMPVGFLLGLKKNEGKGMRLWKVTICGLLVSFAIESLQLITKTGTFEIDDMIYNAGGCVLGACVARICHLILTRIKRRI